MGAGAGFRGAEAIYTPQLEVLYYIDFDYFKKAGTIPKLVIRTNRLKKLLFIFKFKIRINLRPGRGVLAGTSG